MTYTALNKDYPGPGSAASRNLMKLIEQKITENKPAQSETVSHLLWT
jgi:hypothetical protein